MDKFAFECRAARSKSADRSPHGLQTLLLTIAKAAGELGIAISELRQSSFQPVDWAFPDHRNHLSWLSTFIEQAAAGRPRSNVEETDQNIAASWLGCSDFVKRLTFVVAAANEATRRVDRTMFKHSLPGYHSPQLKLVWMAAPIWKSLSGRPASANKVVRTDGSDPDFVQFLAALAAIVKKPAPSRKQVQGMLKKIRAPAAA